MPEEHFTPSEVKIIEMLASIQTTQKFTLDRLDSINGTIATHDKELHQQSVFLEGHRHELATLHGTVQRNTELLTAHEAALQQSRGIWRAVIAVSAAVSLVITALSVLLANRLFPPR